MNKIANIGKGQKAPNRPASSSSSAGRVRLTAKMQHVESSLMRRVDYDETSKELDITFTSGKTYRYLDVSHEVYSALIDTESKGQFFSEYIKDEFVYCEVGSRGR